MRPLLAVDGDSFAHRAYHALPEEHPPERGRRLRQHAAGPLGGRAAARRPRRLGHPHRAHIPARGLRALPERARVRGLAARAARAAPAALGRPRLRDRQGARVRGGRLPRGRRRLRGEARRRDTGRHLGPRPLPAREPTHDDPPARARGLGDRAHRPGRGSGALRRRARAGAGLHRPARRSLRPAPGRGRDRAEEGGRHPPAAHDARGRIGRRALRRGGGGSAPLPANCHARRLCPAPSPRRPETHVGRGVLPHAGAGA